MKDNAIDPVAPSGALARNAPSRILVSKRLKSYSAFTSAQPLLRSRTTASGADTSPSPRRNDLLAAIAN